MRSSIFALLFIFLFNGISHAFTPAEDLKGANQILLQVKEEVKQGSYQAAKSKYEDFVETWQRIEEGIKKESKTAYGRIEDAMGMVQFTLSQDPPNQERILNALDELIKENQAYIDGTYPTEEKNASKVTSANRLILLLDRALDQLQEGEIAEAAEKISQFRQM